MPLARLIAAVLLLAVSTEAAIRRDPTGVNVNSQGPTTVFITFGGLQNQRAAEAFWCGDLIPAAPDLGSKCAPGTIFGRLPLRYDQSRQDKSVFTDIMSIPATVARRAYEAARSGQTSTFFYVRRFVDLGGGPDEFVFVTCRLAGMGARVPFSLLDVQVRFDVDAAVLPIRPGTVPPKLFADLTYNGTGRLVGRWEIVLPGDEPPSAQDLLTEATLPIEQRGTQRRYTQVGRFNVFLPPTGRARLEGPDPSRLPTATEGLYQILFRVEASNDKESDSNLALAGAGTGIVHSGGVAGFPMPVLRYYVGSAGSVIPQQGADIQLVTPLEGGQLDPSVATEFAWTESTPGAAYYRVEVVDAAGTTVLAAITARGGGRYNAPRWLAEKASSGKTRWRVVALDANGEKIAFSAWRELRFATPPAGGPVQ